MNVRRYPFVFPLDAQMIADKRAEILANLLSADKAFCSLPARGISLQSLMRMLELYDRSFFAGCLKELHIQVTLSSRMTSSAGKFIYAKGAPCRVRQAEIRMSSDFLLRMKDGPFTLNGLTVATPQEAFLLVFEHELCHAAETLLFGKTGHSDRFLSLAKGLFGHTATTHRLPTRRQEAADIGLHIGNKASFIYQGKELSGTITYIGKTATVMVASPCGEYRDSRGKRYAKYRVPLTYLR